MLPGNERTKPPLAARASAALALAALAACLACLVLARPALASPSYSDVGERGWYGGPHGCVAYVSERGFMTGYEGTDLFGPDDSVTRAQAVTAIYRAVAGDPEGLTTDPSSYSGIADESGFSDTRGGEYCTAAVNWAAAKGVARGSGGLFRPDDPVTREELMAMMYRSVDGYWPYGFAEPDVAPRTLLDEDAVSEWAVPYLVWGNKFVIYGYPALRWSAYLMPQKQATRAEAAKMLKRFDMGNLWFLRNGYPSES